MAQDKIKQITTLYEQTAKRITSNADAWRSFLLSGSRLYKYSFPDQLLIYAQRPEATACASYKVWNERMGRFIRRGSVGIALIAHQDDGTHIHYVFDVSDTGRTPNAREFSLWQYEEIYRVALTDILIQEFSLSEATELETVLHTVSEKFSTQYWNDHESMLLAILDGNTPKEYNKGMTGKLFRDISSASVEYMLYSRCGLDTQDFVSHPSFHTVAEYGTEEKLSALGCAVNTISGTLLRQIERTVKGLQQQTERMAEYGRTHTEPDRDDGKKRDDLRESGGLLVPGTDDERGPEELHRPLGAGTEGILAEGEASDLQPDAPLGDADVPSAGDRFDSGADERIHDRRIDDDDERDGGTESGESDPVDEADEQLQVDSGGDHPGGTHLRLNEDDHAFRKTQGEQLDLFSLTGIPSEAEQVQNIEDAGGSTLPAVFVSDDVINHFLRIGSNADNYEKGVSGSRMRIVLEYEKQKSDGEIAPFLHKVFHGGFGIHTGPVNSVGFDYSAWYADDGIHIAPGKSAEYHPHAIVVSWLDAAKRIRDMIQQGNFATNSELSESLEYEYSSLSRTLGDFVKDVSVEGHEQGYLSHLIALQGSSDQPLVKELRNEEFRKAVQKEFRVFVRAYRENRELMRYHHYDFSNLEQRLHELDLPLVTFSSSLTTVPEPAKFITDDEVNHVLMRCGSTEGSKDRIFDYIRNMDGTEDHHSHTDKEKADFIRECYGIGGSSHAVSGCGWEDHDSKGLTLKKQDCLEVFMRWNQVARRMESLIDLDRFFDEREKKVIEERKTAYEETQKLKEANPDTVVLYQCGRLFFAYGDDADAVKEALNRTYVGRQYIIGTGFVPTYTIYPGNISDTVNAVRQKHPVLLFASNDDGERSSVLFPLAEEAEQIEVVEDESVSAPVPKLENEIDNADYDCVPDHESSTDSSREFSADTEPVPEIIVPVAKNFHITDDHLGEGTVTEKFERNVEAIRTLFSLETANRPATEEEQKILSRYVGWGGLADMFDEDKQPENYKTLKELLPEKEYASARASVLNAHFTSPVIIRAIYDTIDAMGFHGGNILEPAMGIGNFFGMLPESMEDSRLYGVELDSISARISRMLYPNANITEAGFETTDRRDFFDLAIGNVPFGQYTVNDPAYRHLKLSIHDYFFCKALEQMRPGGIFAFVTSRYTMDKEDTTHRRYLAERAELLGAIRLPNTAFHQNAGTEVVSDILFFQKRESLSHEEPDWIYTDKNENRFPVNRYFRDHPEQIAGVETQKSGRFGMEYTVNPKEGEALAETLSSITPNIHGVYSEAELPDFEDTSAQSAETLPADPQVKNYSYTMVGDEIYYRENSIMVKPALNETAKGRVRGMVELRDCMRSLLDLQLTSPDEEAISAKQSDLNRLYDTFTAQYGLINANANRRAFSADSSYYLLASLEILDDNRNLKRKADVFTKRTIQPHIPVNHVDTASEALAISISEHACVDLPFMVSLMNEGTTAEQIVNDLRGIIFKNPKSGPFDYAEQGEHWSDGWETQDEYLSGNVRTKLQTAKMAAESDPFFSANVEYLEKVQPKDLEAGEIEVRLGATWIQPEEYREFMFELFDTPRVYRMDWYARNISIRCNAITGEWTVQGKSEDRSNIKSRAVYGTDRANGYKILEESLNLRDIRIYDTIEEADGSTKRVLNAEETTLAAQKQQMIRDAFSDWVWKDSERREKLVRRYNDLFNAERPREYDGSHITFVGMNPEITLREHQRNAIAHILYGGNVLLAHAVGAGKTYEMVASVMESKRLGLCHKALIAVPNHLTLQMASEFLQLYPSANILVATERDFETKNRKRFCARIATGNYDAVIMGHSQFEKIPVSMERQERLIRQQIDELTDAIAELKEQRGERFSIKDMERTRKSLESKLEKLQANDRKDDVVTFEELGVDRLYVDEAHNYKNCYIMTKMRNVAGLTTTDAQKSADMLLKCQYLDEITGGKGIVFATGTPVSNSMTELYTMQRYLQADKLREKGLYLFDSWASTFGETVSAMELAPEGTGYRMRTRFAKFFNLPELMSMFREVADVKTSDQLKLPVPEAVYHNVVAQPTETQKMLVKDLSERAVQIHNGFVSPTEDNMLKVTSDGRKLGLDQRIISTDYADEVQSKVNRCLENLMNIWEDGKPQKLTQLVFCDISTPTKGGEQNFNVYNDLRKKLIARGVPKEEIEFIHDADTEQKKATLFSKVRDGSVRILFGSTAKMGAGTNCQTRLYAIHDLDAPWRPGDLEQRSGRIIRQGNTNPTVHIYRYVTEGTFDAYLWQTLETKQKFISQIMTSKTPVRACEDVDETTLSFAEIKALCAGDPRIKEKMDLDVEVSKLKLLRASYKSQQFRLQDAITKQYPSQITKAENLLGALQADKETLDANPHPEDGFCGMEIFNFDYADKQKAADALMAAVKSYGSVDGTLIGHYRGMTLFALHEPFYNVFSIAARGKATHLTELGDSAIGAITRIENAFERIPARMTECRSSIENTQKQMETAKAELEKPFAKETEFKEKSARLAQLTAELSIEKQNPQKRDRTEYEEER